MQASPKAIKAVQTAINRARHRMGQHTKAGRPDKAEHERQHLEGLQEAMALLLGPERRQSAEQEPSKDEALPA